MKFNVRIRKATQRPKQDFFMPLMLIIVGLSLLHFSQTDFDEQKVNQSLKQMSGVRHDSRKQKTQSTALHLMSLNGICCVTCLVQFSFRLVLRCLITSSSFLLCLRIEEIRHPANGLPLNSKQVLFLKFKPLNCFKKH